jgi:hypothetical protein
MLMVAVYAAASSCRRTSCSPGCAGALLLLLPLLLLPLLLLPLLLPLLLLLLLLLLPNELAAREGPWLVSGVAVTSRRSLGVQNTTPVCCSIATVVVSGSKPWSDGSRNDTCTAGNAQQGREDGTTGVD